MFYVYRAIGPTGVYVGRTNDFERRKREHLRVRDKLSTYFHRALAAHQAASFTWELVLTARTFADAAICERLVIAQEKQAGNNLYNLTDGGEGGDYMREASRQPPSPRALATLLCFASSPKSEQHRARIGEANRGKIRSEETRKKLSDAAKARDPQTRVLSLETRQKLSQLALAREARKRAA